MIYTKEPWEIHKGSTGPYIIAKEGNGNHVAIAQVFPRGVAGCETEGNARLLKLAPKMYGALKEISEGKGAFSKDRLTHAENTIADMKTLAIEALAEVEGKEEEHVSTLGNTK